MIGIEWGPYLADAVDQIIKGNYSDRYNLLGTLDAKYLANTAGIVLKEIDADTYREILETCETVAEYKRLYGGSYNNEVIEDIVKRINNGELDGEVSAELVEEVLSGVKKGSNVTVPNIGFDDFNALKNYLGSPGEGNAWHHIVEQSQIGKRANFDANQVHNVNNIIAIPTGAGSIHSVISAYYSSIPVTGFTNKLTIRDWLASKSFEEQFEFGLDILKQYGDVVETNSGWKFIPFE